MCLESRERGENAEPFRDCVYTAARVPSPSRQTGPGAQVTQPCTHGGCPHPCHTQLVWPGEDLTPRYLVCLSQEQPPAWLGESGRLAQCSGVALFKSQERQPEHKSMSRCVRTTGCATSLGIPPESSHSTASTSRDPAGFSC